MSKKELSDVYVVQAVQRSYALQKLMNHLCVDAVSSPRCPSTTR